MSKCPAEEKLGAFIDAELPAEEAAAVEAHVAACAACRGLARRFQQLQAVVVEAAAPQVSEAEWAATWSAIAEQIGTAGGRAAMPERRRIGLRERLGWLRWAAAAAVVALAVGLWGYLAPPTKPPEIATANICIVEYLEPAEGYVSAYSHSEETGLTLITVMPVDLEE